MKQLATFLLPAFCNGITVAMAQAVTKPSNFVPQEKWQIEIMNTLDITKTLVPTDASVWDLDLYHIQRHPEIVDFLRRQVPNVNIICYFNAGLAQPSDCDWESTWQTPQYSGLLGKSYDPPFGEEKWINIKNQTGIDLIKRRVTLARDLGCDGVDPDNIDGYTNDVGGANGTGWNTAPSDYINFVTQLAQQAHSLTTKRGFSLLIGQKNAPEITTNLSSVLDFAVLEDCKNLRGEASRSFCRDFQPYISAEKPVFSIEYPTSLRDTSAPQQCRTSGANQTQFTNSCANDTTPTGGQWGNYRFSEILKLRDSASDTPGELNGCTQYCGRQGAGVVVTAVNAELDGDECPAVVQ